MREDSRLCIYDSFNPQSDKHVHTYTPIMSELKTKIYHTDETRDKARVTKAKLGLTWDEFIDLAAEKLDPDNETHD